ncbi:glycerol-3-phosphate dehydrogenase [Sphingomonas spermidinifaciens]|uniref:Glycerol-3-phosphate dehydrogenase n=1 Tax=Sphingomonas spermidinifaciens TaxID=1141889 RepID=A0A2A4B7B4_9SPHN|nr:glycerol-3-phosphate dehydrogenase [Sphingomonas spermidinifaciens]PCD03536.1 glycerol-3-phosphate dehydrogenase [Sphingomonas spermidinifaciens]
MTHDLLVIGGGINGCAIAREAALLGLSVLLVERDDLASHTSSASTKLIHGGLRYLEQYEFRLVREALGERERMLAIAPHLVHPLTFVLPHDHAVRPWWLVRAGLWLYDALGFDSSLPRSRSLRRDDTGYQTPLRQAYRGFVYSDAWVDDARLTVLNAVDAADHGAEILTRTGFELAEQAGDHWRVTLSDGRTLEARAIVVAAGGWTTQAMTAMGVPPRGKLRLVRGSHIVVPELFEGDHAYILQQPDRRIVFAIPYPGGTMLGTTDVAVEDPSDARISPEETQYLCDAANRYFRRQVSPAEVVSDWSGIRALYDDGAGSAAEVTRDYVLELHDKGAPVLGVFGGKITTARALAEDALGRLAPVLGFDAHPVSRARVLPGAMIADIETLARQVAERWPFLDPHDIDRMARAYGSRLIELLDGVDSVRDLGRALPGGMTEREARFLHETEFARAADDVLDRRTKLGLGMSEEERRAFADWWATAFPAG